MITTIITAALGIGLTYGHCEDAMRLGVAWQYDWSASPPACACENVPMLWGAGAMGLTIGGNSEWLMGFNEPDVPTQANLTPHAAALLWRQIEQQHPTQRLVSPATVIDAGWLAAFRDEYRTLYGDWPRIDALAIHWYGDPALLDARLNAVEAEADAWGVGEVWVTEFSAPTIDGFRAMLDTLRQHPRVTRYAPFAARISGAEVWAQGGGADRPLIDFETGLLTYYGLAYIPNAHRVGVPVAYREATE